MESRREPSTSDGDDIVVGPAPEPEGDSVKVLAIFLLYSMAMFSLPFMAFFGTKYFLKTSFHIEGFANTAWSVVSAVVVINVIILTYACRGYDEAKEDEMAASNQRGNKSDLNEKKTD